MKVKLNWCETNRRGKAQPRNIHVPSSIFQQVQSVPCPCPLGLFSLSTSSLVQTVCKHELQLLRGKRQKVICLPQACSFSPVFSHPAWQASLALQLGLLFAPCRVITGSLQSSGEALLRCRAVLSKSMDPPGSVQCLGTITYASAFAMPRFKVAALSFLLSASALLLLLLLSIVVGHWAGAGLSHVLCG